MKLFVTLIFTCLCVVSGAYPYHDHQFYVQNTGQFNGISGEDLNIFPQLWEDLNGHNVHISIFGTECNGSTPALKDRLNTGCLTFQNSNCFEPGSDPIGTAFTSVIVGNKNSGCTTGIAYQATATCFKVARDFKDEPSDATLIKALRLKSNSHIVSIPITPQCPENRIPVDEYNLAFDAQYSYQLLRSRNGLGLVPVFSPGECRGKYFDPNYRKFTQNRIAINVAASTNRGDRAYYSPKSSNLLFNVPSTETSIESVSFNNVNPVYSEGNDGKCYPSVVNKMTAANAIATGGLALIMQAKPYLTWRTLQLCIALSSTVNDANHSSWIRNAAGVYYSTIYGFGRLNVRKAIEIATLVKSIPQEQVAYSTIRYQDPTIPSCRETPLISTHRVKDNIRYIESVAIEIETTHANIGDLMIEIESPSGTRAAISSVQETDLHDDGIHNYFFTCRQFLGEDAKGKWNVYISAGGCIPTGRVSKVALTIYGMKKFDIEKIKVPKPGKDDEDDKDKDDKDIQKEKDKCFKEFEKLHEEEEKRKKDDERMREEAEAKCRLEEIERRAISEKCKEQEKYLKDNDCPGPSCKIKPFIPKPDDPCIQLKAPLNCSEIFEKPPPPPPPLEPSQECAIYFDEYMELIHPHGDEDEGKKPERGDEDEESEKDDGPYKPGRKDEFDEPGPYQPRNSQKDKPTNKTKPVEPGKNETMLNESGNNETTTGNNETVPEGPGNNETATQGPGNNETKINEPGNNETATQGSDKNETKLNDPETEERPISILPRPDLPMKEEEPVVVKPPEKEKEPDEREPIFKIPPIIGEPIRQPDVDTSNPQSDRFMRLAKRRKVKEVSSLESILSQPVSPSKYKQYPQSPSSILYMHGGSPPEGSTLDPTQEIIWDIFTYDAKDYTPCSFFYTIGDPDAPGSPSFNSVQFPNISSFRGFKFLPPHNLPEGTNVTFILNMFVSPTEIKSARRGPYKIGKLMKSVKQNEVISRNEDITWPYVINDSQPTDNAFITIADYDTKKVVQQSLIANTGYVTFRIPVNSSVKRGILSVQPLASSATLDPCDSTLMTFLVPDESGNIERQAIKFNSSKCSKISGLEYVNCTASFPMTVPFTPTPSKNIAPPAATSKISETPALVESNKQEKVITTLASIGSVFIVLVIVGTVITILKVKQNKLKEDMEYKSQEGDQPDLDIITL